MNKKNFFRNILFFACVSLATVSIFQFSNFVSGQTGNPPGDAGQVLKVGANGELVITAPTITNEAPSTDMILNPTGNIGIGGSFTAQKLNVEGNTRINGNLAVTGIITGTWGGGGIVAGKVASGVFGSEVAGGDYSFPAFLGVNSLTNINLPQHLSVYGGGYFSGSVGIGTIDPGTSKLKVVGIVESTSGGFKFPDQTIQTTAAGGGAPTDASYLTLGLDGNLSAERVLTAGGGISFSDTLANGTLTITAADISATNEIQDVITSGGLRRVSNNFGLITCADASVLKYNAGGSGSWGCAVDDTGLPSGTVGQTLRHNGTTWIANSLLYNNGAGIGVGAISLDTNYKITTSGGGIKAESDVTPAGYFSSASGYGLIVNSGNVGIGTTAPLAKLHVNGSVRFQTLNCSSFANGGALTTNASGDISCSDDDGGVGGSGTVTSISAGTGLTATPDPITTAGTINVGVNSTLSTAADTVGINLGNPNTWTAAQTFSGDIACGTNCITLSGETSGNYVAGVIGGSGITVTGTVGEGWFPGIAINTAANLAWSGVHTFSANTNFPVSGIWNASGNVGIGTTAPGAYKLSVAGDTWITGKVSISGRLTIDPTPLSPDVGNILFGDGTGWRLNFGKYSDSGATKFMTIQDNGNVGIGVTLPRNKFDVEGAAVIGVNYSGTNTAPANGLLVEGNVGIGTTITNSGVKLSVAGYSIDGIGYLADGIIKCTGGISFTASTFICATPRVRADFNGGIIPFDYKPVDFYYDTGSATANALCLSLGGGIYSSYVKSGANESGFEYNSRIGNAYKGNWELQSAQPITSVTCEY